MERLQDHKNTDTWFLNSYRVYLRKFVNNHRNVLSRYKYERVASLDQHEKPIEDLESYRNDIEISLSQYGEKKLNYISGDYSGGVFNCDSEKGNKKMKNIAFPIVDNIKSEISDFCLEKIKERLGKGYLFLWSVDSTIIIELTKKLIKRYDKNFKLHTQQKTNTDEFIINKRFIIPVGKYTYVLVATGNKINSFNKVYTINDYSLMQQNMYMFIFGKHWKSFSKKVDKFIKNNYSHTDLGVYYVDASDSKENFDNNNLNVVYSKLQLRIFNTLFFSNKEKEKIIKHIDNFLNKKELYKKLNLNYKTGILLYGEPGTGKSSLAKAIATKYNRNIVVINLSNLKNINLTKLAKIINIDEFNEYIILLEDIDTLFLNRNDDSSNREDKLIINKLLQFLDSNTSPSNVIFIATTNNIDILDPALIREGRFDLKIEVKGIKKDDIVPFGKTFGLSVEDISDVINQLESSSDHNKVFFNQSKIQTLFLNKLQKEG